MRHKREKGDRSFSNKTQGKHKRIQICHVHIITTYNDYNHYVLQTCSNKKSC